MENFKFIILSMIVLAGLGLVGYWAVVTIEPGNVHLSRQRQTELETENANLKAEVVRLKNEVAVLQPPAIVATPVPATTTTTPPKPVETTTLKYQSLINDLQKLVGAKVVLKEKSSGTRVGTLQTFLNIYNKTSKRVDNDFGPSLKTDIITFQKAVGLPGDGEAGPGTFQKMIDWLKKQ